MQDRMMDRRPRPGRRTIAVAVGLIVGSLAGTGCSSMPFMPDEGGGARFNLATVDHVASREKALRKELEASLDARIEQKMEAERARIGTLEQGLADQQMAVESLAVKLDLGEVEARQVVAEVRARLDLLAADALELRHIARGLDGRMEGLPTEALRQIERALDAHLAKLDRTPPPVGTGP